MKEFLSILNKSRLFLGLNDEEILSALNCLSAKTRDYQKGVTVLAEGETPNFVGLILDGDIEIQKMDYDGNSNIISRLYKGDVIAAAACYSTDKKLPFDIYCPAFAKILCLNIPGLIQPCQKSCAMHIKIIENLLSTIADANIRLTNKINILTKRTIREKLLEYLYGESKKSSQSKFEVSLSRQQMADYLSVDRSALSRELSHMREENILDFDGNFFWLK